MSLWCQRVRKYLNIHTQWQDTGASERAHLVNGGVPNKHVFCPQRDEAYLLSFPSGSCLPKDRKSACTVRPDSIPQPGGDEP
jgi:hypothetical protein